MLISAALTCFLMNYFCRKLYALLHTTPTAPPTQPGSSQIAHGLHCLRPHLTELNAWWSATENRSPHDASTQLQRVAAASDRVNLQSNSNAPLHACHPISGQKHPVTAWSDRALSDIPDTILKETCPQKVFWWFWRFDPERLTRQQPAALLFPAHTILPDCPLHSYQATVSALVGARYSLEPAAPDTTAPDAPEPSHPYLLHFSFSPVQEFIKASRKFLDFWAGSYLLHYLSARLCWHIAQRYGPDAVIVPSLWSQEIIDALLLEQYPDFEAHFADLPMGEQNGTPVQRFNDRTTTSLSTAGFPNVITALVPGKDAAEQLGQELANILKTEWSAIGEQVREDMRTKVSQYATQTLSTDQTWDAFWKEFSKGMHSGEQSESTYKQELQQYRSQISNQHEQPQTVYPNWAWTKLWEAQLENTWEPYWTAVPLGYPGKLEITKAADSNDFNQDWLQKQQAIAQAPPELHLPTKAELAFHTLNVGTWWGSIQQRLRLTLQAVKHTRVWQIPAAPGERSTISGQFSAVHPFLNYTKFPQGGGLPEGSMRLFWLVMSKAYPGLFNGSERLNALELTKRMAWKYGGVAAQLGIATDFVAEPLPDEVVHELYNAPEAVRLPVLTIDYEKLIRFPNLSSIAAARFAHDHDDKVRQYWKTLARLIRKRLPEQRQMFGSRTRCRAFNVSKTDKKLNLNRQAGQNYNGVMFSSKWLAEDMNLNQEETKTLRGLVDQAHKETGFGDGSPADWWTIVLADGDGMGQYVSGQRLLHYDQYLNQDAIADAPSTLEALLNTKKRMGPATHIGLNRALIDFSNRLVPYLTEHRFCGKVIYSGGDDVMAVLPLEDLPEYLLSLRSAWSGDRDPFGEFGTSTDQTNPDHKTGYWHPTNQVQGLPRRPHFTMGQNATMSMGIVIAHKSVPLPTVLESLWTAEQDRAKKMPGKDGLCFRVIYGSGNQLEALMKGELLEDWWHCIKGYREYGDALSPLLYRLAEELPHRACVTKKDHLFSKAAKVIMSRRDEAKQLPNFEAIQQWLDDWEKWVYKAESKAKEHSQETQEPYQQPLGTTPEDLGKLLRFTAFWVDKRVERWHWVNGSADGEVQP